MTTVGILLVIPEPFGGELQVRRAAYGDPAVSGVPTHVTLLPPTEVEPGDLPQFCQLMTLILFEVVRELEPLRGSLRSADHQQ